MTIIIKMTLSSNRTRYILQRDLLERLRTPSEIARKIETAASDNRNTCEYSGWIFDQNLPKDWKYQLTPNCKSGWVDTEHGTLIWDFGLEEADQFIALIKGGE